MSHTVKNPRWMFWCGLARKAFGSAGYDFVEEPPQEGGGVYLRTDTLADELLRAAGAVEGAAAVALN